MSDTLKLKYKVGEIEFEAEGPADAVEQQRINFMNAVLPAAVNAMVQTRSVSENKAYIETAPQQSLLEAGHTEAEPVSDAVDYSRVSLSSFLKKYINREKTWDLVYIGGENGRLNRLIGCFEQIDKSGIKYKFSIIGTDKEKQRYADKICYSTPVEYEKIVEQESKSNTILEVLSDKQMGTTLRALEAVILNKKFLTNNKRIVDLPFYNPKYIQIFDNPEKIDFEFVKREENINYHYKEECSPIRLIEKIHEYDRRVKNENYDHV